MGKAAQTLDHPGMSAGLNNRVGLLGICFFEINSLPVEHLPVMLSFILQGKYAEAKPLCARAHAISEKVFGPKHPKVAYSLSNWAALLSAQVSIATLCWELALPTGFRVYDFRRIFLQV